MRNLSRRASALLASLVMLSVAACGGPASTASSDQFSCPNGGTVRMGVEPFEDASTRVPLYQQIGDKLSSKLGCKIQMNVTTNYTAEVEAMRSKTLELRPPAGDPPLGDRDAQVMVTTRLGGLLREYSRAAA